MNHSNAFDVLSFFHERDFTLLFIEGRCVFSHSAITPSQNTLHVRVAGSNLLRKHVKQCALSVSSLLLLVGPPTASPWPRAPAYCGCQSGPTGVSKWPRCHDDTAPARCCAATVLAVRAMCWIARWHKRPHPSTVVTEQPKQTVNVCEGAQRDWNSIHITSINNEAIGH